LSLFRTPEPGDAVYVISDGGDNASRTDSNEVEHALLAKGVRFYMLLLHDHYLRTEESERAVPLLTRLADETGGGIVDLDDPPVGQRNPRLEASLSKVYSQMTQFYELGLGPLKAIDKEERWDLEVVDSQGKKRKDIKVTYPRKLPACGISNAEKEAPVK
jgi:hypothetical protein